MPPVTITRSQKRVRSSSFGVRDGGVHIRVPGWMSNTEVDDVVAFALEQLGRRASAQLPDVSLADAVPARATRGPRGPRGDLALVAQADAVADRWLDGIRATRLAWSHRMHKRWASCTVMTGHIRVSSRLADAPHEVLDNILLHELAHLLVADHGPAFHQLMARDPRSAEIEAWLRRRSQLDLRAALGVAPAGLP